MSLMQKGIFAQPLRYVKNFILGIFGICLW